MHFSYMNVDCYDFLDSSLHPLEKFMQATAVSGLNTNQSDSVLIGLKMVEF